MKKSMQYYEDNYEDYVQGWSKDHIHYGFWFDDTRSHEESLVNHTREVLKHLNIQPGNRVLDAGCGSGGSSRYIVENYTVETVGVMLSPTLLKAATELSKNLPNSHMLRFYNQDYTHSDFRDASFDRIFSIESVCQEPGKDKFISEAYRLLCPQGRLVVADFFLLRKKLNEKELRSYREWCDGWFIPDLASTNEFCEMLTRQGFANIEYHDKTNLLKKSGKMMHDAAKERLPEVYLQYNRGNLPQSRLAHVIATYRQWECIEWKIWRFGMFVADKL
ncbi:MAG: class I SAM-dependent methyltransferase [Spirochaetes bacterium]|nr:class I SAM-dependent methyltransferase [Spirochaetota bacterium]